MTEFKDGVLAISGSLTMATVPALFPAGVAHLENGDMQVDLSRVDLVDSAAVSLLLGWLRAAQHRGRQLRITGLPEDLSSLARLYGVDRLLPQAS
ncbi:MAG: STAS domain-containing protein [Gallionella sp.]|jgi:phospholipid transport system transporter-binding protein|nr:STAS domain-containing protein [Gallionella sp.]